MLTLTFFGNQAWRERELRPGRWGLFAGKVTEFRGQAAAQRPGVRAARRGRRRRGGGHRGDRGVRRRADPGLPGRRGGADLGDRPLRAGGAGHVHAAGGSAAGDRAGRAATWSAWRPRCARSTGRPARRTLYRARRRLKWDEAFAVQLTLVQRKHRAAAWPARPRPPRAGGLLDAFDARLPYELTAGQRAVGEEIAADLATAHPMHRLLQGEVGSGKTVVRAAGDAPGGRRRRAGGAARADRGARRPAPPGHAATCSARWAGPVSWTAPTHAHPGRAGHRLAGRGGAAAGAGGGRRRRAPAS